MKISVDDKELFSINEIQKRVIMNEISEDIFEEDMMRRLLYVISHKYEQCFERLKKEWEPKLALRVSSLPTNKEEFARLVFAQPEYCSRKVRDEKEASEQAKEESKDAPN